MTGKQRRRTVSDRARRRAIRGLAARLGVAYSVAARLLTSQMVGGGAVRFPTGADMHRAWLFAMRERRTFDLRLRDTRLAAQLPLGRAAHLTERFPPLRRAHEDLAAPLYDGDGRQAALAVLYALLAHEAPELMPTTESLAWVGELGEETAVDGVCARLDRAARLLLDEDPWRLCTRIEAALEAFAASLDSDVRSMARALGPEFREMVPRRSFGGARHILDALLAGAHDAHPPGTRVRVVGGEWEGLAGLVVGARWRRSGPPTHYEVWARAAGGMLTLDTGQVALDEPVFI